MGWRDRDYAKWTDEERRRFLGSSAPTAARPRSAGSTFRAGAALAIATSTALLALGQIPRGHPLLPAFHFTLPSLHRAAQKLPTAPTIERITLPRTATSGSFLTLRGQLAGGKSGTVSIEGATIRPPWRLLAAVPATDGSYTARIRLSHTGFLHLRISYPDGHHSIGSIRVR